MSVNSRFAGELLPPSDRDIDIGGIDLDSVQIRPTRSAAIRVVPDPRKESRTISSVRRVQNRVGYHGNWFHRWMKRKEVAFPALIGHRLNTRILPDVSSVPAELTELDVVPMGSFPFRKTTMNSCCER